jgi:hypothetical protein
MKGVFVLILWLGVYLSGCGTEIGNGSKRKNRDEDKGDNNTNVPTNTSSEGGSYNYPDGSPFKDTGSSTIPILGALINYCNSPGKDFAKVVQTFTAANFTLQTKEFEVEVTYKSGFKETATGTSSPNFLVGLPTYTCKSFNQDATATIPGINGTFIKKTQELVDPSARTLKVVWFVDETNSKIARIEFTDTYETITATNDDYK